MLAPRRHPQAADRPSPQPRNQKRRRGLGTWPGHWPAPRALSAPSETPIRLPSVAATYLHADASTPRAHAACERPQNRCRAAPSPSKTPAPLGLLLPGSRAPGRDRATVLTAWAPPHRADRAYTCRVSSAWCSRGL